MTPNKFSPRWNPQYVEKLKEHLAQGERFTSFARVINVNERTIYSWCKEHPQFAEVKATYKTPKRQRVYA